MSTVECVNQPDLFRISFNSLPINLLTSKIALSTISEIFPALLLPFTISVTSVLYSDFRESHRNVMRACGLKLNRSRGLFCNCVAL